MSSVKDLVQRLATGTPNLSDFELLESTSADEIVAQICPHYPEKFLNGQTVDKKELGFAKSVRHSASTTTTGYDDGHWKRPTQRYRRCVLLTSEFGKITTVAYMAHLRIRPASPDADVFELDSGPGISFYHATDGWKSKLLESRTITLTQKALKKRGWLCGCE